MIIHTDTLLCEQLAAALRFYAEAAYPPGGSECGQAARESLLNTAAQLASNRGEEMIISRRVLPRLRAAIDYYCENHVEVDARRLRDILA